MMFEQYSYKIKFKALIGLFVLLSVTAYKRSFSTFFKAYTENSEMRDTQQDILKKSKARDRILKDLDTYDRMLGRQDLGNETIRQQLVGFASSKPGMSIVELLPEHAFFTGEYKINTNQIIVRGNLDALLDLSYRYETNFSNSRVTGIDFYKGKGKNQQVKPLQLKLFFQNYETDK